MNQKNMTYLANLIKNFGGEKICQINLNTFDAFGENNKTLELAKKMVQKGTDYTYISEITGLSKQLIKTLE